MNTGSKFLALLVITMWMSSCGGSAEKAADDAGLEEDFPVAEAATDPVPADQAASPEQPVPPVDATSQAPVQRASEALASGAGGSYSVKSGDTLMKIAYETYGDFMKWRRIYAANQGVIPDPMNLKAGTVLQLEAPAAGFQLERNGTPFLIRRGDTLGIISDEVYGTQRKWRRLWENNRQLVRDPNKIYAGFYLYYVLTPEDESEKLDLRTPAQTRGGSSFKTAPATSSTGAPLVAPGTPSGG